MDMEYRFAKRLASLKPSLIREILKSTSDPSVISFCAGSPAFEALPVEQIRHWTNEILAEDPALALQYSITDGHPPFRAAIRQMLHDRYGIGTEQDDIIVTTGAQQAIDLAIRCLCDEGDTILCESPSFIGSLNCFRSYRTKLVGVDMQPDGIDLDKLEAAMKAEPGAKVLYLIPNFQNPTGITTSWEKRKAIYELACRYDIVILEDNPYGDLRFTGEHIPAIKTLDTEGRVIYCGTFSKILSPGLRVGYACANKEFLARMVVGKQCNDVHSTMLAQLICHRFLTECDLDAHLQSIKGIYAHKYQLMHDAIEQYFAPGVHQTTPEGGLFIWCSLPEGSDMMAFCNAAMQKKVAAVPGIAFLIDPEDTTTSFRLNFSTPTDEHIVEGIKIMGELSHTL